MVNENRRRFLTVTLVGGGTSLLFVFFRPGRLRERFVLDLETFLSNPELVVEIGSAYLRLAPEENDVETLGTRVFSDVPWSVRFRSSVARALREAVRGDFREGRVVLLSGWQLSLTEARVCAIAALASQK